MAAGNRNLRKQNNGDKFYAKDIHGNTLKMKMPERTSHKLLGLRGGHQTIVTKIIADYASRFKGEDLPMVDAIVRDISTFERVVTTEEGLKKHYAKRTAEDVIASRKVIVKRPVQGCVDYTIALCSALRAKGISSYFARNPFNHAVTLFRLGEKWYRADPTPERVEERFHLVSVDPKTEFRHYSAIGVDAWDIGLNDISRFELPKTAKGLKNILLEEKY